MRRRRCQYPAVSMQVCACRRVCCKALAPGSHHCRVRRQDWIRIQRAKDCIHCINDDLTGAIATIELCFGDIGQVCHDSVNELCNTPTPAIDGLFPVTDTEEGVSILGSYTFGKRADGTPLCQGRILKFVQEQMSNRSIEAIVYVSKRFAGQ